MRKFSVAIIFIMLLLLSACASDESVNNFKIRKDSYLINDDKTVIVEYKTNEDGKLVELTFDRLLTIEDMFYYNTEIDYDVELEGYSGDIFTEAGFLCTTYQNLNVPTNIEVGNTRFKYNYVDCEYVEVDRDNDTKSGSFVRSYGLTDTIDVSRDTIISIVVFDENSIERFLEIREIPHTMKKLGVYSIGFSQNRTEISNGVSNYYRDMAIYEQLLLKKQDNELAVSEVMGISASINLLEFDESFDVTPLIEDFDSKYTDEILAFNELTSIIGVIIEEEITGEEETSSEE